MKIYSMEDGSDKDLTEFDPDQKDASLSVTQGQGSELNKDKSGRDTTELIETRESSIDSHEDENHADSMVFFGTVLIIMSFFLLIIGINANSTFFLISSSIILLFGNLLFTLGNKVLTVSFLVLIISGLIYIAALNLMLASIMSGGWGGIGVGDLSEWGGP